MNPGSSIRLFHEKKDNCILHVRLEFVRITQSSKSPALEQPKKASSLGHLSDIKINPRVLLLASELRVSLCPEHVLVFDFCL